MIVTPGNGNRPIRMQTYPHKLTSTEGDDGLPRGKFSEYSKRLPKNINSHSALLMPTIN